MDQIIRSENNGKTNFDSEFCGSIPLNFINLVQAHGVLMVLEKESLRILQISENCTDILAVAVEDILNKNLSDFIPSHKVEEIKNKVQRLSVRDQFPLSFNFNTSSQTISLTVTIHKKDNYWLLEIEREKPIEGNQTFKHIHQQIKFIMASLKEVNSIEELSHIASDEIKELSGFDRVMIYKFDEDWNGIVIGESREEDMEPYLHLRFPASDIPKQARELYLKNPYRLIPDRSAKPSRLIPVLNPLTQSFTDLSDCNLRSVPAVHLEYLKNMNVTTSMSTPIIKENKLWGLISCHHKTAKYPSYEMISGFELISGIISAQIVAREIEQTLQSKSRLIEINSKILEKLYVEETVPDSLLEDDNLISLFNLGGAAVVEDGKIYRAGITPEELEINKLVSWAKRKNINNIFTTDNLSKIYSEGQALFEMASGLIIIPIDIMKSYFIFGFRPEVTFSVDWGGNPYKAINLESDGKTYHPRNSFSLWKEVVKRTSNAWQTEEIEAAKILRTNVLQRIIQSAKQSF